MRSSTPCDGASEKSSPIDDIIRAKSTKSFSDEFSISQAAESQHLKVLSENGCATVGLDVTNSRAV